MNTKQFSTLVIGDLHGRSDLLRKILLATGFADSAGRWRAGRRRLVQLGDLIDRGPDSLGTVELLMQLQADAAGAGGEVTCLVGNHEAMALAAVADPNFRVNWAHNGGSTTYMEWAARSGTEADERRLPYAEEFYRLFGPEGRYGRWIRTHAVGCAVGEYVVVHAGWGPIGPTSVAAANQLFRSHPILPVPGLLPEGADHPLAQMAELVWARQQPEAAIRAACRMLGCRGLIAGHTITRGIQVSCDGALIQIDVGMHHFGQWAALGLTDQGALWALIEGGKPRPVAGDGLIPLVAGSRDRLPAPQPVQYGPGSLVCLYRAADGAWRQYLHVTGFGSFYRYPAYEGDMITFCGGEWTVRPTLRPAERIDRYGHLARADEVPAELLR